MYSLTSVPSNVQPNFNVCPTDPVDVVVRDDDKRARATMRWGIIPYWWSKPLKAMRMATFNARAESIAEKPMFRDSFKQRRCLMPATGYYDWHDTPEGKQPYYFTRADGEVMTIAAIHDGWTDLETGEKVRSVRWSSPSRTSSWPRRGPYPRDMLELARGDQIVKRPRQCREVFGRSQVRLGPVWIASSESDLAAELSQELCHFVQWNGYRHSSQALRCLGQFGGIGGSSWSASGPAPPCLGRQRGYAGLFG
jgi:hypothetical protein